MGLSSVFSSASLQLTEVPEFVFVAKAGFAGTVTVTTSKGDYTFTVEASDTDTKLVIEGLKAYEIAETLAIKANGTIGEEAVVIEAGQFNLATFASYHIANAENDEASAAVLDLIGALYDYVKFASSFDN